jgi:dienelactone hydrolase
VSFSGRCTVRVVRITLPSGTPATLVRPDAPVMGLVVAPDILGVRPLFDEFAQRIARDWSMSVCVVEPYPGRDLPMEPQPRMAVMPEFDGDAHLRDVEEAADAAGAERIGMIGFCMGGMLTLKAARSDRIARLVPFYGMIRVPDAWHGPGLSEPLDDLAAGHPGRVLAIIGERDPYTPPDDVAALEAAGVTVVRYPEAEHGFAHDPARPAHRPDDARDAFERARAWLLG